MQKMQNMILKSLKGRKWTKHLHMHVALLKPIVSSRLSVAHTTHASYMALG